MTAFFPVFSPVTSFSEYVIWAQSIPNLELNEEKELLLAVKNFSDIDALKKIIFSHLKYVISIAKNYGGYGLSLQDLVQEGNVGLVKALKKFDLSYNNRFVTFADYWIKAEILEYIMRNWKSVKFSTSKIKRKLFFSLRKLFIANKSVEENMLNISSATGSSVADVREMYSLMTQNDFSLDAPISLDSSQDTVFLSDILHGENDDPLFSLLSNNSDLHTCLEEALNLLNEREQILVKKRWLISDDGVRPKLEYFADAFGVSIERVRQIEVAAFAKMRKFMQYRNF